MNTAKSLLISSILISLAACGNKSTEEYIQTAESLIAKGDNNAAIIELKNAVESSPENATARFLLGQSQLKLGSAGAAEKELEVALRLGYDKNQILPLLAKSYNLQFKDDLLINLTKNQQGTNDSVATALWLYRAMAELRKENFDSANLSLGKAVEISSDSAFAKLADAYTKLNSNETNQSLDIVNDVLALHPEFTEAWQLKGQLAMQNGDFPSAVNAFEKYNALVPNTYASKVFLASAYVSNKQFEEAEKELDVLLRINKNQAYVNQLKGLVRYQAQDYEAAKLHTEAAIQSGLTATSNRIVAGVSAYQEKEYEQAYKHLAAIKDKLPPNHPTLKLLAITEIKIGRYSDAKETLSDFDDLKPEDVLILTSASAQMYKEGESLNAKSLADKAKEFNLDNPVTLTHRGILQLTLNDLDGINDLEKAIELEPSMEQANTALARAYIVNGLYNEALTLAASWQQAKPNDVAGYILEAVAREKLKQKEQAKAAFEKVLSIDPNHPAANRYFARTVSEQEKATKGRQYLKTVLDKYPDYIPALAEFYLYSKGAPELISEAQTFIKKAYENNLNKLSYKILYGKTLYEAEKYNELEKLLVEEDGTQIKNLEYWSLLINAQMKSDKALKALETAKQWTKADPDSSTSYLSLIALLEVNGEFNQAITTIEIAELRFAELKQLKLLKIHFLTLVRDLSKAQREFDSLEPEIKSSEIAQGLKGRILLESGKTEDSLSLLTQYYEAFPSDKNATFVAKALRQKGLYKEGIDFLNQHVERHGVSKRNILQIAELAILNKDNKLAISTYERLLNIYNSDLRSLNNIAYLLLQEEELAKSLTYAEKAYKLAPNNPSVLDTYASVLFKNEQLEDAILYFQKAYDITPNNSKLAIKFIEALIADGQKVKAKRILSLVRTDVPSDKQKLENYRQELL